MDDQLTQPTTRAATGEISEVIRPAAIVPEEAARSVLVELALRDVQNGGVWQAGPSLWSRYDRPWHGAENAAGAELIGRIHVAYGTPTKYEITIYRVTVTLFGSQLGWSVESLCDEALGHGGLRLQDCPRATLAAPPPPFRG
ncbi:hypothetical protein OG218_22955 [Kineococcus sp. NBC_00420]|uniref:hypothetical protein n=1 Tax=unclassified Kineococcus TaxID=2621656 RepID=UPI002E1CF759